VFSSLNALWSNCVIAIFSSWSVVIKCLALVRRLFSILLFLSFLQAVTDLEKSAHNSKDKSTARHPVCNFLTSSRSVSLDCKLGFNNWWCKSQHVNCSLISCHKPCVKPCSWFALFQRLSPLVFIRKLYFDYIHRGGEDCTKMNSRNWYLTKAYLFFNKTYTEENVHLVYET
jgi:hypothetical protein